MEEQMQYQLKLQQLVTYARCRIYRRFIRTLAEDTTIRLNGDSCLFYFMLLCSMVNFQTSYLLIEGRSHTVAPGEWIINIGELMKLYRVKTMKAAFAILDRLSAMNLIGYTVTNRCVSYKITNWSKFNTVIEANAPCTKDDGFFFFPYALLGKFIGSGKCSEMDIILDLWLNTIYNDRSIPGSDVGPVVYIRNGTRSPLVGYEELSRRWGISKSTAGRIMRKLEDAGYIKLMSFPGKYGTAIYLCSYLSTMFQISDITIDKEEVAMSLNIKVTVNDTETVEENTANTMESETSEEKNDLIPACQNSKNEVEAAQICVPKNIFCVPKSHLVQIVQKAAKALLLQGIPCCSCTRARYLLYPLSDDCNRKTVDSELIIRCLDSEVFYRFALSVEAVSEHAESEVK